MKKILRQDRIGGIVINILEFPDTPVEWAVPAGTELVDWVDGASIGDIWDGIRYVKPAPAPRTRRDILLDKLKDDSLTLPELRELLRLERS